MEEMPGNDPGSEIELKKPLQAYLV